MRRLTGLAAAVAIALLAQTGAAFAQNKSNPPTGPQEQPGPFAFPGIKSLSERLMLSGEQHQAVHTIYNEYRKQEQKLQQEKAREAQQAKNPNNTPNPNAPALPDAGTLKGNMIMEIRMILNEEQKKKFQEIVDDLSKKKKKNNN